ncbi:MAG: riboflavin synthase [Acidothermus sp.]|nr:riboflavin synthase [Acidothermus sp.]
MFTGIVEALGTIVGVERNPDGSGRVVVAADFAAELTPGESVAVDGVCLTVARAGSGRFVADLMPETLTRTTLGTAAAGREVNLERAAAVGDRLGGHLVTGHVDATAAVLDRAGGEGYDLVRIELPEAVEALVAPQGSVALDGVSLTVIDVAEGSFTVGLIPTTLRETTLGRRAVGERVNLEADVVAKYVRRAVQASLASFGVGNG